MNLRRGTRLCGGGSERDGEGGRPQLHPREDSARARGYAPWNRTSASHSFAKSILTSFISIDRLSGSFTLMSFTAYFSPVTLCRARRTTDEMPDPR